MQHNHTITHILDTTNTLQVIIIGAQTFLGQSVVWRMNVGKEIGENYNLYNNGEYVCV